MKRINQGTAGKVRPMGRVFSTSVAAILLASGAGIGRVTATPRAQLPSPAQPATVAGLPLNFEPNLGQAGPDVRFLAHGPGYAIALTEQGAELALGKAGNAARSSEMIRVRVQGAQSTAKPTAEEPLPGRVNYFIGSDRSKWHDNIATYGRVRYTGVYPGIDLLYYGRQGKLEYDFAVAPGASSDSISLRFEGAERLRVDSQGNLKIRAQGQEIAFERPVAYQQIGERRVPVEASYRLSGTAMRFKLGAYDHSRRLIIDPVLSYFSYLGGSAYDVIGALTPTGGPPDNSTGSQAAAVDSSGNLFVVGYTNSINFPTKAAFNAPPAKAGANQPWAFVTKFAPDAKSVIFSTYIGGAGGPDYGYGIAVDASGNAFIVGQTQSSDFPLAGTPYQPLCAPNWSSGSEQSACNYVTQQANAFVSKLSPSGMLLASTFLGGTATGTAADAVAVDSAGRAYVAGWTFPGRYSPAGCASYTQQAGFPTTAGAVVTAYADSCPNNNVNLNMQDAFVSVFDPTLSTLVYSTLLGDSRPYAQGTIVHNTYATTVTVDPSGNFYLAGWTNTGYLPVTAGALQTTAASCGVVLAAPDNNLNGNCGFVAKFTKVGAANPPTLTYSTYLGHMPACCSSDYVAGIAADAAGDAYVAGYTNSAGFPTTAGAYQAGCEITGAGTCSNAEFIAKLNPTGTQLLAATMFGNANPTGSDSIYYVGPIVLDASGNPTITGVAGDALSQVNSLGSNNGTGGVQAPFVATLNPTLSTVLLSTLVGTGGQSQLSVNGLAVDTTGNIYLAGNVNSPPSSAATAGAFQSSYGGGTSDGFVVKIAPTIATTTTLAAAPTSVTAGGSVTFTATVAPASGSTIPTGTVTFKDGATVLGTGSLSTGKATYTTTSLAVGAHSVSAAYAGDSADSASASTAVSVTVAAPAPTATIAVAPTSIVLGKTATLTWSSTNATACSAAGAWTGARATSGTLAVTPTAAGTLQYSLGCANSAGATANGTATLTVTAPPMPTVTMAVAPTSLTVGASATLTWSSTNATTCMASNAWTGAEATSGSVTVTPSAAGTLVYALACTGTGGSANGSATLTANAASTGGGSGGGGGTGGSHGGGGLGYIELLLLGVLTLARRRGGLMFG